MKIKSKWDFFPLILGSKADSSAQRNNGLSLPYSTPRQVWQKREAIQKPEGKNPILNSQLSTNVEPVYLTIRPSTKISCSSKSSKNTEEDVYLLPSESIHYEGSVSSQLPESSGNIIESPKCSENRSDKKGLSAIIDSIKTISKPSQINEKSPNKLKYLIPKQKRDKPPQLPSKPSRLNFTEKFQSTKTSTTNGSQNPGPSSVSLKERIDIQQSSLGMLIPTQDVEAIDKKRSATEELGNRESVFIVEWKCPNCNFVNPDTNLRCKRCGSQVPEHSKQYIYFSDSLPQQDQQRPPVCMGVSLT